MGAMGADMARLYDVFVDWPGRLGREIPGLVARLKRAQAKKVLDVGCGTGRHVAALNEAGFDAYGADASAEMLAKARTLDPDRFHHWRMGDPPPRELVSAGPFDAITCLGNTWPQLTSDADVAAALAAFRKLGKRKALLLLGLKAVAIRRERNDPYLPLLRREHEGAPLYFVRFVEFDPQDARLCTFHMVVVKGDAATPPTEALIHNAHAVRVWSPGDLERTFSEAGLYNVKVSARLGDPDAPPQGEDVFVHAFLP